MMVVLAQLLFNLAFRSMLGKVLSNASRHTLPVSLGPTYLVRVTRSYIPCGISADAYV
jgi:hypothetical protein